MSDEYEKKKELLREGFLPLDVPEVGFDPYAVLTREFAGVPEVVRTEPAQANAADVKSIADIQAENARDRILADRRGRKLADEAELDATDDSSLEGVDMFTALDTPRAKATVFKTATGGGIFYAGMSNAIYGKGGEGKSMLAAVAAVETLLDGGRVLWIDYEQDASGVGHRLLDIELNGQQIERSQLGPGQFSYRRPELPLSGPKWDAILEETWDLVVIDSINQALGSHIAGGDAKEGSHVNQWDREVRQPLTRTGACVLTIDHIPKNVETPTPYGAQEKTSTLSGSSVFVKPHTTTSKPSKGKFGQLELIVQKDRHGDVETDGSGTKGLTGTAAVVDIDSTDEDGKIRVTIKAFSAVEKSEDRKENDLDDFVLGKYREAYDQGETLTNAELESMRGNWKQGDIREAQKRLSGPLDGRLLAVKKARGVSYKYANRPPAEFEPLL